MNENKNKILRRTMIVDGSIRMVEYAEAFSGTALEKAESISSGIAVFYNTL